MMAEEAGKYPKAYMYRRIVAAKMFIDKNYKDKLDLNAISNESNFSRYHFIRLFKQAFGQTPHQYLTAVRIDKAKECLNNGMTVSVLCYEMGFDSLPSFSKMFKKRVGVIPITV
jgi:AraC-like DNA-binding protein